MAWRDNVKSLMRRKKVTQEELMPAFDVTTRGAVGHYLNGRRQPSIEQLLEVAKRLGVTVSELVGDAEPSGSTQSAIAAMRDVAPNDGGVLDSVARAKIGERIFSEIKRTKRRPADVAARLGMSAGDFSDRARTGDLSLEDLAEIVLYLGQGAALDYIVLGRFPLADSLGPAGHIIEQIRARSLPQAAKSSTAALPSPASPLGDSELPASSDALMDRIVESLSQQIRGAGLSIHERQKWQLAEEVFQKLQLLNPTNQQLDIAVAAAVNEAVRAA